MFSPRSHRLDAEPHRSVRSAGAVPADGVGPAGEPAGAQQLEALPALPLCGKGARAVPGRAARGATPAAVPVWSELLAAHLAGPVPRYELAAAGARRAQSASSRRGRGRRPLSGTPRSTRRLRTAACCGRRCGTGRTCRRRGRCRRGGARRRQAACRPGCCPGPAGTPRHERRRRTRCQRRPEPQPLRASPARWRYGRSMPRGRPASARTARRRPRRWEIVRLSEQEAGHRESAPGRRTGHTRRPRTHRCRLAAAARRRPARRRSSVGGAQARAGR